MQPISIKRALFSVADKRGVVDFAKELISRGVEIIASGGTSQLFTQNALPHLKVEEVTGVKEMIGGRVKTLHPAIHAGILAKRDDDKDEMEKLQINFIDLVVVNFYPFQQQVHDKNERVALHDAVEWIDIGGPTLVRAAAKNFQWVVVVTDPDDYDTLLTAMHEQSEVPFLLRSQLAAKAFAKTAQYDALVTQYLRQENQQDEMLSFNFEKAMDLRYGENPHQKASVYQYVPHQGGLLNAKKHQGKSLSYNNLLDADAAWQCIQDFQEPTCVIIKHANPCGIASALDITVAYRRAYAADSQSAFGGIVALNRPCTLAIAKEITAIFMEVIIAPTFSEEALELFAAKPNLRVLEMKAVPADKWEKRFITGALLVQEKNHRSVDAHDLKIVTHISPTPEDIQDMLFAWRVIKHMKSNAILLSKNKATVGIGAGQVSRVDAVALALLKAKNEVQRCILASDAFFPFRDSIDLLCDKGIRAIIQPGGSMRDDEVVSACNELGIAMVFTGLRSFKH